MPIAATPYASAIATATWPPCSRRKPLRKHLLALDAFSGEVARVRDAVSEPALGEIRLQWWRDALTSGDIGGHPIATALIETVRTFALPLAAFEMLLDARSFDLYDDPMPSLSDLEGYAGETTSSLLHLAAMILAEGTRPRKRRGGRPRRRRAYHRRHHARPAAPCVASAVLPAGRSRHGSCPRS